MVTDRDRKLHEALSCLYETITTFSTALCTRNSKQEAHLELVLLLLDVADQVLRRMVEGEET